MGALLLLFKNIYNQYKKEKKTKSKEKREKLNRIICLFIGDKKNNKKRGGRGELQYFCCENMSTPGWQ
jgi:hypothetical protein